MALVVDASPLSGGAEGLAGAASGPDWAFPSRNFERVGPPADPGEEVALVEPFDIVSLYFLDRSCVDFSGGDQPVHHQIEQPVRSELVVLIVVGLQGSRPMNV